MSRYIGNLTVSKKSTFNDTSESVSLLNGGAFTCLGGGSFVKSLRVGNGIILSANPSIQSTEATLSLTASNSNIIISSGGVLIDSTTESSNNQTGALVCLGGGYFEKKLYIGNKNITPNAEDVTEQTTFFGANNQTGDVIGLLFPNSRSFKVLMSIIVIASNNLYAQFEIQGVKTDSGWWITNNYVGDDTGVDFSITSAGQIQYTSSAYTSFVTLTMCFKAQTIKII
jgi:hypothetical protein